MRINFLADAPDAGAAPAVIERGAGSRQRLVGRGPALAAGRGGVRRVEGGDHGVLRGDGGRPRDSGVEGARGLPGRGRHRRCSRCPTTTRSPAVEAHRQRAGRHDVRALDAGAFEVYVPGTSRFATGKAEQRRGLPGRHRRVHAPATATARLNRPVAPAPARAAQRRRDRRARRADRRRCRGSRSTACSCTSASTSRPRKLVLGRDRAPPSTGRSRRCSCRPGAARGDRGRRLGDQGRGPIVDRARRHAAGAALRRVVRRRSSACKEHPEWQAALRRRGIDDLDQVQIDPWPAGSFGVAPRERPPDQPVHLLPARVAERQRVRPADRGLIVLFDHGRGRGPRGRRPRRRADAARRGALPPPTTSDRARPTSSRSRSSSPTARASGRRQPVQLAALVVPRRLRPVRGARPAHGRLPRRRPRPPDPAPRVDHRDGRALRRPGADARLEERVRRRRVGPRPHGATRSQLGCDCLGEIHYFDAVLATEQGEPYTIENAICMHEEDYGILWKHIDLHGGTDEVRRSRRLVVSFIATVGNYEYGFFWYLYLDGNIQFEVKLTGIVSPMAIEPGEQPEFANVIAPGLAAPLHQHLFSARLDLDVDGPANIGLRGRGRAVPAGPDNPWGNAFRPQVDAARHRARRRSATPTPRPAASWKIVNPACRNAPRPAGRLQARPDRCRRPTLLASPGVEHRPPRRLRPAQPLGHALRRRRAPRRRRVPEPARGGDGLPRWTAADRSLDRHRRRALVHVRRHALRAARGLAGHAGRVHRVPALAVRLLRPQPGARRPAGERRGSCHAD